MCGPPHTVARSDGLCALDGLLLVAEERLGGCAALTERILLVVNLARLLDQAARDAERRWGRTGGLALLWTCRKLGESIPTRASWTMSPRIPYRWRV